VIARALMLAALMSILPALVLARPHQHGQPQPTAPPPTPAADHDHGQQDHAHHDHGSHDPAQHDHGESPLPLFIPPITDEDRAAAFPDVQGHTVHDTAVHSFVLFDQLEWQRGHGMDVNVKGWVGGDLNRFWFRTEGEGGGDGVEHAEVHALYGRAIARWWDVVAGIRQDVRPGPAQTWAAIGIQGLAPYWFEVEATAYVSTAGRTHLRLETEYEFLLTNRLILQPVVEVDLYGTSDPERRLGAGLSSAEAGLRLRYEIRREFAPYIGVVWNRTFFGTADYARAAGDRTSGARLALGLRLWM
jgi:copper resistance protein B